MRLLYFVPLILLISCSGRGAKQSPDPRQQEINDKFYSALNKLSPSENAREYKAYLVIPNMGCSGCITSAETMLKTTINRSKSVKFVLTNIESLKMLNYKMGFDVTKNNMVLVDRGNLFNSDIFNSIYPQIFFIRKEDGFVYKKMEVSPNEDGMAELTKQILTN